jgi:hypothetical protein
MQAAGRHALEHGVELLVTAAWSPTPHSITSSARNSGCACIPLNVGHRRPVTATRRPVTAKRSRATSEKKIYQRSAKVGGCIYEVALAIGQLATTGVVYAACVF